MVRILSLVLLLHIWICAEDSSGKSLGLATQSLKVASLVAIAQDNTHATSHMSLGLAENAHTGIVLSQSVAEVIVERLVRFYW